MKESGTEEQMVETNPLQFLAYLTPTKVWNVCKGAVSYGLSIVLKKPIIWGMPFYLHLESTTYCNLRCRECPTGMGILTRPQGQLSFARFRQYYDPIKEKIIYLVLYFQGEPFLNPELLQMIRYARDHGTYTMVSSNGHFFQDEVRVREVISSGLGTLVVSLDGMSQETYERYRKNGDLKRVMQGLERFMRVRREMHRRFPRVYLQFLVLRHNEHEVEAVRRFGRRLGVDKVLLKTAQIYHFSEAEEILPRNPRYRRYQKVGGTYRLKGRRHNRCFLLWSDLLVTWDGVVLPCCFDKDGEHVLGELNSGRNTFTSLWRGEKYQEFRARVFHNREQIDICRNCTQGVRVFIR